MADPYPYEFNPEDWRDRSGDPFLHLEMSQGVTSPVDVFRVEIERRRRGVDSAVWNVRPSDSFIWAYGEPDTPWVTKLGGVPYRPADAAWPQCKESEETPDRLMPMTFLMQFCFHESLLADLNLPGDVLLVFAKDEALVDDDAVVTEWHSIGIEQPMNAEQIPTTPWKCMRGYGYRWRTWDVDDNVRFTDYPHVLRTTKIGGIASCTDAAYGPQSDELGTFLCQIGDVCPATEVPYPWINVEQPIERGDMSYEHFGLCDAGVLCFFLSDDGTVNWRYEYY